MAEIIDIEAFKARKLAKSEADFNHYMDRAEAFQKDGKNKFAAEMLEKAKGVRKIIDKLRSPIKKPVYDPVSFLGNGTLKSNIIFDFSGLASADFGYPKQSSPSPTPTPEPA